MYHYMDSLDKDISREKNDLEVRDEASKADSCVLSGAGIAAGTGAAIADNLNPTLDRENQQKFGSPVEKLPLPPFVAMTNVDLTKADFEDIDSDKTLLEKIDETKEEADENRDKSDERDYLDNTDEKHHECEKCHDKSEDHADGQFLDQKNCVKPPPSSTTDNEENDWIVDCLYYSMVCCDCAIM